MKRCGTMALAVATLGLGSLASGAAFTWNGVTSSAWATTSNWTVLGTDADGLPDGDDSILLDDTGIARPNVGDTGTTRDVNSITLANTSGAYNLFSQNSGNIRSNSVIVDATTLSQNRISANAMMYRGTIDGGGVITFSGSGSSDLVVRGIANQSGTRKTAVTKNGNYKLILPNSNAYSGASGTVINAGTLEVTNASGSATGAEPVSVSGGTLAGNGIITGIVTVTSGAIAPGTTVGTALALGSTDLNGGALNIELDATVSDMLVINGDLDVAGAALNVSGTPALPSYVIATYSGTLAGTFAVENLPSGYSVDYGSRNNGQITLIPEPSALALAGLLALGLRRRK